VSLELSTIKPRFGVFPELTPWFLEVRRVKKAIFREGDKLMMKAREKLMFFSMESL